MQRLRRSGGRLTLSAVRELRRLYAHAYSHCSAGAFAGFGRHSVLEPPVRVAGAEHIRIGSGVWVGAGCWLHSVRPDADGVVLELGDGTNLAGNCTLAAAASIRLGAHVLLARGVYIADHSHAFGDREQPIILQGIDRVAPIVVEDGCWLGQNVVVCPGVRIGRNAVIGANSVVTRDVPERCVAVGAPARVIRHLDLVPEPQAA
jgi:acetyltransferase-like isoleucine patch superfamily enzyme